MDAFNHGSGCVELDRKIARDLFARPAFAISRDKIRYYLNGVCLHDVGGRLAAVATDGHRLCRITAPIEGSLSTDRALIVPHEVLKPIGKLIGTASGTVTLRYSGRLLHIEGEDFSYEIKPIDGTFPDYERLLTAETPNTVTVGRAELKAVLKRFKAIADPARRTHVVELKWNADGLRLCAAESEKHLSAEVEGEDATAIQLRYFIDLTNAIRGDRVRFRFGGADVILVGDPGDESIDIAQMAIRPQKGDATGKRRETTINAPPARTLRSYQERAATYLYESNSAFLIAPLGAGKGAAALTAIAELIRDGHRRHALVVAPKLVAETVWPAEIASWPHLQHLRVAVLNGGPERRKELLATAAEREVTVIGVDLVPWLVDELAGFADDHPLFDLLAIDETSRLKDPSGKRARALLRIAGRFRTRWGLTGTPRPNSAMDLFMPTAIISDGALWGRAFVPWQKQHFRPRDRFGREWAALPGAEERIAADFGTIAMVVADQDMPDLPPLNIVVTRVALPDSVMATYRTMQRELFAAVEGRAIEAVSRMVATGKCAQLANGFVYGEDNDDPVEVHSVKIDWLKELVETLDGEPLLIAYEFIEDLRAIWRAFGKVPALGGLTPAGEAAALVEAWNAGKLPLLAFHPASAGHGLNLQFGGSRMAWIAPSWSAELTEQAIARIYRPGQTRRVTVHVCVAAGTVDEMKRDRVLGKMSAQDAFKQHLERV